MAVELATAYVTLIPSAKGITSGVTAALSGAEIGSAASKSGEQASKSFASGFKGLGGLLVAAGVAEGFASAIKGAANFQAETELLVTAGGEAQSALSGIRSGIEGIAVATGTSTGQLAEGMYTLEKAGIRGASGLDVLRVAAEGAKAENVDLGTMTNALTSIMRSYNLPASQATNITNELVAASGAAKTTMQEFAGSLSTVLPVASAAGLSFAQVGGAIATLTSHGTSAQEATQELANTIRNLQAPNAVASHEMAQFGINSNTVSTQLGKKGLTGTLAELTSAITSKMGPAGLVLFNAFNQSQGAAADMKIEISKMPPSLQTMAKAFADGQLTMSQWRKEAKSLPADQRLMMQGFMSTYTQAHKFNDLLTSGSPAAQTYAAALEKMLGGATGLNTALMLTGGSAGMFTKNVDAIAAAGEKGGKDISTWAQTQTNFNVQMDRLGQVAATTGINLGTALLPKLTAFGGFLANNLGAVKIAGAAIAALAGAMLLGSIAAKGIAAAEGVYNVLTGEAAAKTGLQVVALGVQKAAMLAASVATKAFAVAQAALNVVMDANPIVLIGIALVALVAGIVLAYQHCAAFRAAVEDVWKAIQKAANVIAGAFVDAWHTVVNTFDTVKGYLVKWGPLVLAVLVPFIGIPLLIVQHFGQLVSFFESFGSTILAGLSSGFSAVVGFFTALPGEFLSLLSALPSALETAAQDAIAGFIVGLIYAAIGIWTFFTSILPTVLDKIGDATTWLVQKGEDVITGMVSGLTTAVSAVAAFLAALPGELVTWIGDVTTTLLQKGKDVITGMVNGYVAAVGAVHDFIVALPGKVLTWVGDGTTWLLQKGKDVVTGMFNGFMAMEYKIHDFIFGLPGNVVKWIGDVLGTLSSKGGDLITGLVNGAKDAVGAISSFVSGLPGVIGGFFSGCVNWLVGAGEQIMHGLLNGITSGLDKVKNFVGGIANKIVSWKGPPAYDATILIGNGKLIMQGLLGGISSQMPALKSMLNDVSGTIADGVTVGPGAGMSATVPTYAAASYTAGRGAVHLVDNRQLVVQSDVSESTRSKLQDLMRTQEDSLIERLYDALAAT